MFYVWALGNTFIKTSQQGTCFVFIPWALHPASCEELQSTGTSKFELRYIWSYQRGNLLSDNLQNLSILTRSCPIIISVHWLTFKLGIALSASCLFTYFNYFSFQIKPTVFSWSCLMDGPSRTLFHTINTKLLNNRRWRSLGFWPSYGP